MSNANLLLDLDFYCDGWRDDPEILNSINDDGLIFDLAISFFSSNPSWMDDCVPAAIRFQLDWLANLFEDDTGNDFVEETRKWIFRYISGSIVSSLLHWESNRYVGVDYE